MRFVAAPEFPVFPTRDRPLSPYEAVVAAVAQTRPAVAAAAPDVVVHDILTLAPALSGELESVPVATLIPHLYPPGEPGFPPFGFGAQLPRTRLGGAALASVRPTGRRRPATRHRRAQRDAATRRARSGGTGRTTVSAGSCAWSRRCPSWSIRGRGPSTSTSSAR